jgi:ERCC4-type nuclease
MRIKRTDLIQADPALVLEVIEKGTLGNKLGLLRAMPKDHSQRAELSESIITEMLSRHRRIDHREHPLMIGYFSQLGFEVAHLKTGEGDLIGGEVSIERKEDDFMDSLFDNRWLRQLGAMREEAEYSFLIVTKSYLDIKRDVEARGVSEQVLTGFVASLCAVGYPPIFIEDKWDASVVSRKIMDKIADDSSRLYVPRPKSPKPQEYRNAIIEALPKIGKKTRRKLVEQFESLSQLSTASMEELLAVEGIGKATAEKLYNIFNAK